MLMLNSLVIMPPLKSTKPGADVDNNGDNVNDNYDEWSQLIMITFMMNDRAHHDGDNDDDQKDGYFPMTNIMVTIKWWLW